MLFSSLTFLFVFLPVVLVLYYLVGKTFRNYVLLFASLFFYYWGEPNYLLLMVVSIVVNYVGARFIEKPKCRKIALVATVAVNLAFLLYFKYINFFIDNINSIFHGQIDLLKVALPIGISFYTFQSISYLVDVYRGDVPAQKNFLKLALYICLFPQLIAGPIVKYHDVAEQINARSESLQMFVSGVKRFIVGLSKKVLIANSLATMVDSIYNTPIEYVSNQAVWLVAILYPLQLFFDFSGYSDMAIGLGRMFGFSFKENFNFPYISKSITEFWRRWHISLSSWFKEYLYIPLGGNRKGKKRQIINIVIVFFFTGMWHGANWTFIIWGLWHGLFNVIEKLTGWNEDKKSAFLRFIQHVYALVVVIVGWMLFRAESLQDFWVYFQKLIFIKTDFVDLYDMGFYTSTYGYLMTLVAILFSMPVGNLISDGFKCRRVVSIVGNVVLMLLFLCCIASLVSSSYNPFIYFRF